MWTGIEVGMESMWIFESIFISFSLSLLFLSFVFDRDVFDCEIDNLHAPHAALILKKPQGNSSNGDLKKNKGGVLSPKVRADGRPAYLLPFHRFLIALHCIITPFPHPSSPLLSSHVISSPLIAWHYPPLLSGEQEGGQGEGRDDICGPLVPANDW